MMELYSAKVYEISKNAENEEVYAGLSYISKKEKKFLCFLLENHLYEFTPLEVGKMLNVTNRTVINRCTRLVNNGFIIPNLVKERIRSYKLSDMARENVELILQEVNGKHQDENTSAE